MSTDNSDSIAVAIRVRPLIKREKDVGSQSTNWKVNKNMVIQVINGKPVPSNSYVFDHVFDQVSTTDDVYREFAQPVLLSVMEGFNGTIFAYGQTSSGKTHTMMGTPGDLGIIPKAINEIFEYIDNTASREFIIVVSYMEIYNEVITDLLKPGNKNLKVHENQQGSTNPM